MQKLKLTNSLQVLSFVNRVTFLKQCIKKKTMQSRQPRETISIHICVSNNIRFQRESKQTLLWQPLCDLRLGYTIDLPDSNVNHKCIIVIIIFLSYIRVNFLPTANLSNLN